MSRLGNPRPLPVCHIATLDDKHLGLCCCCAIFTSWATCNGNVHYRTWMATWDNWKQIFKPWELDQLSKIVVWLFWPPWQCSTSFNTVKWVKYSVPVMAVWMAPFRIDYLRFVFPGVRHLFVVAHQTLLRSHWRKTASQLQFRYTNW